ncbi:cytochrome P450 sterol C-22 desaturase [Trichodelitschia bisporula]|uniref:sterol 22-desaturase n=1 Tax=Trichodelitschia bisporula TaxID=703511 RepID=A0A6G1I155_9PEZI|nr:cytochrome P450 sterol C-22 desaturase [Trichodelitschia bisporula]
MAVNATMASPVADAQFPVQAPVVTSIVASLLQMNGWMVALTVLLGLALYDQCMYIYRKGSIVGPAFKIPFMGPFLESVNPKFSAYHAKWMSGPLSCVSVFHKFVVIASTRDMARKILNSPNYVKPCVVDVAHKLLRPTNWVFLDGKEHVDYRKGLNILFTHQALEAYLPGHDIVYDKYFQTFVDLTKENGEKPLAYMPMFRELMCALSCRTFVGTHMDDATVKKISDDFYLITAALELVNFPFIIPFTKTWYGKKAADMVLDEFAKCAAKSKERMAAGGEVHCIMDGWIKSMMDSEAYRQKIAAGIKTEKPNMLIRTFTNFEISQTIFTLLFASQDATSSAVTWLFQIMADRPDLLDKVREENLRVRNGDRNAPLTLDLIDNLTYTRAVVKETLRYRPPVLMVPYIVKKDFPITPTYTVPKGAMVIPTTYPSLHDPEAYPNPDSFEPDRWITGDAEAQVKNWLVFGTGPHYCLGQLYVHQVLASMIGKASMHLDWKHKVTPLSEEIKVFATIFPMDDCLLTFSKRP